MDYKTYRLTVSPDPTRIVNKAQKRSYYACTKQEQYNILKASLRKAVQLTQQCYNYNFPITVEVYFEFNEMYMMHCHGTIIFGIESHSLQDESSKYFQRMVFRELGRPFIKGKPDILVNACCDITCKPWEKDKQYNNSGDIVMSPYRTWLEYCLKDQVETHTKYFPYFKYYSCSYDPKDLDIEQKNL